MVIWYFVHGIKAHDFCHMPQLLAFIDLSDKVITQPRKQMKQIRHVTSFENSVRNAGPLEVCVTKDTYVKTPQADTCFSF